MATIKDLLREGADRLEALVAPRLEAEILLAHAAGMSRAALFARPEYVIEQDVAEAYRELIQRRAGGEPIAYITGEREFWSLPLTVTPAVLIPRPETELLVEAALARIPEAADWRIADLGTGSGAVAIALASERPNCEIHATDLSSPALDVARANATRLGLGNIRFHPGSWFEPLAGTFDLVASNPPYVAAGDPHLEAGDLRFEPDAALVAGPEGLEAIRAVVADAPARLRPGGWLLLEHGMGQTGSCRALFEAQGFDTVETLRDLAGSDRVTLGAMPAPPKR